MASSSPFDSRSEVCGTGHREGIDRWVVSLEFGRPDCGSHLDFAGFTVLMNHLRDSNPTGVWHSGRYRIAVEMAAPTAFHAVQRTVAWHRQAVRAAGVDAGVPVRVEVHAAEEPQWSRADDPPVTVRGAGPPGRYVSDELMVATRHLLAATTPGEVGDILDRFVVAVGGRVEPGALRSRPGIIDVDLSVDGAPAHHGTAPSLSVAGLMLEQSLPTLLIDAEHTMARLRHDHSDSH